MRRPRAITYITVGEDITSPLLRRQVLELLAAIKHQDPERKITLVSFLGFHSIVILRKGIHEVRGSLKRAGIKLRIIPSLVPWPIPHFRFYKTDTGYRARTWWSRGASNWLGTVVWPIMAYYSVVHRARVFHCRSYPAAYAAIRFKKLFSATKVIFDPRSDFVEENVTAGKWAYGDKTFVFWKSAEGRILASADAIACISPSHLRKYISIAPTSNYFTVPNNVDWERFRRVDDNRRSIRGQWGVREDELVFCYLGALTSTGWHRADIYAHVCKAISATGIRCRFAFLTPPHGGNLLRNLLGDIGNSLILISPPYEEVPKLLAGADYGLMFLDKRKLAVGTKIGEYLAAGLPLIANKNCIGAAELIEDKKVGHLVAMGLGDLDPSPGNLEQVGAVRGTALSEWSVRVSSFARSYFDNTVIASRYAEQYKVLGG